MFYEEFILFPEGEDTFRAEYTQDNPKIRYILPYITDGYTDLIKCINHEWYHAMIDWALDSPHTKEIQCLKNAWDSAGDSDHYIMRFINYD